MADVNVRIPAELAEDLKLLGHRRQLSMSELIRQLLLAALASRGSGLAPPLPVGLSDLAKELDEFRADQAAQNHWLFVYRAASGRTLIATGSVEKIEPMFVKIRLTSSDKSIAIPRPTLVAWKTLQSQSSGEIFHEVYALQQWGAFLHPAIFTDSRAVNSIQMPPESI